MLVIVCKLYAKTVSEIQTKLSEHDEEATKKRSLVPNEYTKPKMLTSVPGPRSQVCQSSLKTLLGMDKTINIF